MPLIFIGFLKFSMTDRQTALMIHVVGYSLPTALPQGIEISPNRMGEANHRAPRAHARLKLKTSGRQPAQGANLRTQKEHILKMVLIMFGHLPMMCFGHLPILFRHLPIEVCSGTCPYCASQCAGHLPARIASEEQSSVIQLGMIPI